MENSRVNIYDFEQGSEAWFDIRCGRITASKFAKLMSGESTVGYKELIIETAGQIISGEMEDSYSNAHMERGVLLEEDAREFYEDIMGVEVTEVGFVTNEDFWPELVGVSPDGLVNDDGQAEIKCPMMKTHIGYLLKDQLPSVYKWQVQGQLLITGREYSDFISYFPNLPLFVKRVLPDKEMHEQMEERLKITVQRVQELVEQIKNK